METCQQLLSWCVKKKTWITILTIYSRSLQLINVFWSHVAVKVLKRDSVVCFKSTEGVFVKGADIKETEEKHFKRVFILQGWSGGQSAPPETAELYCDSKLQTSLAPSLLKSRRKVVLKHPIYCRWEGADKNLQICCGSLWQAAFWCFSSL